MRAFIFIAFFLVVPLGGASEVIPFKQPFSPSHGGFAYGFVVLILLLMIGVLARKYPPRRGAPSLCLMIEKKTLSHKTILYVLEYEKKRFLLVDNQHAIVLERLDADA